MPRDRYELEQDRADLLRVLEEADGAPVRTGQLIAEARGVSVASVHRYAVTAMADLRALHRKGLAYPTLSPAGPAFTTWRLGVDPAVDVHEDFADVARQRATWEPA